MVYLVLAWKSDEVPGLDCRRLTQDTGLTTKHNIVLDRTCNDINIVGVVGPTCSKRNMHSATEAHYL